jgi:hypothetical protein
MKLAASPCARALCQPCYVRATPALLGLDRLQRMFCGRLALHVVTIAVAAAAVSLLDVTAASAGVPPVSALQAGMTELAAKYGVGAAGLFGDGTCGWRSAVTRSTVRAYEQATGDRRYLSDVASTYSEYVSGARMAFPISRTTVLTTRGRSGIA